MVIFIIALLFGGLIIGALGRLIVPGPNPIGVWATIAAGLTGSLLGGLIGHLAFGWRYRYSGTAAFVLAVIFAALIVALLSRGRGVRGYRGSRSQI
jgi:uncharacterized membrane protein YeaQ/YmgE (transglycosylase-associated protein family)